MRGDVRADPNFKDEKGMTSVAYAAFYGFIEAVKILHENDG